MKNESLINRISHGNPLGTVRLFDGKKYHTVVNAIVATELDQRRGEIVVYDVNKKHLNREVEIGDVILFVTEKEEQVHAERERRSFDRQRIYPGE